MCLQFLSGSEKWYYLCLIGYYDLDNYVKNDSEKEFLDKDFPTVFFLPAVNSPWNIFLSSQNIFQGMIK